MTMSSDHTRGRAVSSTSTTVCHDEELTGIIDTLRSVPNQDWRTYSTNLEQAGVLQQLRFKLKDVDFTPNPQDAFRRAQGFQVVVEGIHILCESWLALSQPVRTTESKRLLQLLGQFLFVIESSLVHHSGNNRFFRTRVANGAWSALLKDLSALVIGLIEENLAVDILEQLYGLLFAAAAGDEALTDLYTNTTKACPAPARSWDLRHVDTIQEQVAKYLGNVTELALPDLLPIVIRTWSYCLQKFGKQIQTLHLALPVSLKALLALSKQNVVEAHTAGLLSAIIPLLFDGNHTLVEKSLYRELALLLFQQGVTDLHDAHHLFAKASTSAAATTFLLEAVHASRQPACIQFDLSRYGSSSVELPTLRRAFPHPQSDGYTLALWARFDSFDRDAHTTLFGACDRTQTCFILAYLEKDSHQLILQTAVKGSKPSVRFKTVIFRPGEWYHICVVHRKPRTTTSSKAYLYVNGVFVEQSKANFPLIPPADRASTAKVQAFLGTPQDLAPNTDTTCTTMWSLASAMLFGTSVNEDLVAIMYYLGPEYHGNLQDCLGSFQTYSASAALNFRNESLNAGNENTSILSIATRQKASTVLPEDSILLNISPAAILDNDDRNNIDESQLVRSLSKTAAKNLASYIRSGANAVAINGAVPAINDALVQANGVALLIGEPVVTVPQSMDDVSWRLGGCAPLGLSLVSNAKTTEDVATTVELVLATIKDSWRNSEVMERSNGYSILASILRDKLAYGPYQSEYIKLKLAIATPGLDRSALSLKLLKSVLTFLGYDHADPSRSMIVNPLAYKTLLIDNPIWRTHHFETQDLYFKQFVVFARDSMHAKFNLKRFTRMRVVRRLLEASRSENVSKSAMSAYSTALEALLPTAMSAEMLRTIALFITYSVHKTGPPTKVRKPARSNASSISANSPQNGDTQYLTRFEIGVEVLRLYSNMLCKKDDSDLIKKFAKTVTNKWLLYLLSESSSEVIVLSMRILARLLVLHGDSYVKKFRDKSGGFTVLAHRLKRWWHLPALWPICFAILFGIDIAQLDFDRVFNLFSFVDLFNGQCNYGVVYPEMFEVIATMLQSGLKTLVSTDSRQSSLDVSETAQQVLAPERLSMSTMAPPDPFLTLLTPQNVETFQTIIRFLADIQCRSVQFREYAITSNYTRDLLSVLFPVVVGSDTVDAAVELNARDSTLSFDGPEVQVQPLSQDPPTIKAVNQVPLQGRSQKQLLRRGSSFVFVAENGEHANVSATSVDTPLPKANTGNSSAIKHNIVQTVLEIVVSLFIDQILTRKDFNGLGLFLKTPPGFVEHQTFFESWILRNTVSHLSNHLALHQQTLQDAKVLNNLARFLSHLCDAIYEGWFVGGTDAVVDLASAMLEYLQQPDVSQTKSVRLCVQQTSTIRAIVFKLALLNFSQLEAAETLSFLKKVTYWQNVLLAPDESQSHYSSLLCYLLYSSLVSENDSIANAASDMWRTMLVQKPAETSTILSQASNQDQTDLVAGFSNLASLDNEAFLAWVADNRAELDVLFFETLSKGWIAFVTEENEKTEANAKARVSRRRDRLRIWAKAEQDQEELVRRHDVTFDHWTANIYASETLKHQRSLQDQSDDLVFTQANFVRMRREMSRATGLLYQQSRPPRWRVDQTEGRNRMRMRLVEDYTYSEDAQQPKRKGSDAPSLRVDTKGLRPSSAEQIGVTPGGAELSIRQLPDDSRKEPFPAVDDTPHGPTDPEEAFEFVEDPNTEQEDFEDRNRKVMRSLRRGDQVKHVANISRIAGLEAVEGLLILGKDHVYLIDNFFQRADGEIVHVKQAPTEERDPYVGMISGRNLNTEKISAKNGDHESRSWKWSEVISVSKRRFLFRDVAVEMFFGDGRSYLLTVLDVKLRNELYSNVNSRSPQYGHADSPNSEISWRYDALKSADDEPQTLGAKFASVFAQSSHLAATKRWQKGELSNFHYLMLLNTLAGRTYNDLTQYPVFPWVIADYSSEELDLSNPATYRDLSKPMGCQNPEREATFRERYQQFAEMGDSNAPAFHYGTHYSSAMIVSSYLIRLQPFVTSYLLLQGGTFDHPDRMFFSIEGAWRSASRTNMTDVRELTPEFFYLPEFLINVNDYDFGLRQSNRAIGNVLLPPWAKGDPRIFVAKHREALESEYVSRHLHKWIDLIFGCKQKGDAAVEAANVFHHLSYQGAKDLDAIEDPVERLATIGIIHNFGQTPHQVFQKPHPAREHTKHKYRRVDSAAESLTRVPGTLLDSEERVASLLYVVKSDRLLCSGAFRINMPPAYDKYMEWGFTDNSIRFYATDSRKQIGLFEHLHIGQLSCALFSDSKTLITAGTDCTVAVWTVQYPSSKVVDLQPKATLFGHRAAVTCLALSRSFNALVSASATGEIILWDLNRCEFVRRVCHTARDNIECVAINDVSGNITVCYGSVMCVFSLNGDLLTQHDTCEHNRAGTSTFSRGEDNIISASCYEGHGSEWLERDLIFTGHKRGIVKVWSLTVRAGAFEVDLVRQLNHVDNSREDGGNVGAGITCILALPQVVYTGDEEGHVVEWTCVQRS